MKISRQIGTISETLNIFIRDATNTSSHGLANIEASTVSFSWKRSDMAAVSSGTCLSTGTLGTYSVSTLTQMSSTLMLGWYEFGIPNAALLSGRSVALHMYGAPNMVPVPIEIELTKLDNQTYLSSVAVSTVSGGVRVTSISIPVGVSSMNIGVNISSVNGVTVTGTGAPGDRWGA